MNTNRLRQLAGIVEAEQEAIEGTNCANCRYIDADESVRVEDVEKELNKQGGTIPDNKERMEMAKEGDLITMPGTPKEMPTHRVMCTHTKIKQYVTQRMCCAYWDASGTIRAYGEQTVGK